MVEGPHFTSRRRARRSRATSTFSREHTQRVASFLFGTLIIGSPMLLGGVFPWAATAIAGNALACLLAASFLWRDTMPRLPAVALVVCLGAVWTCIQALPMPCGMLARLAPSSAEAAVAAQVTLGGAADAAYCTLSRDPGATSEEVVHGIAIVCAWLGAWLFAASAGRRRVFWLVALSSLAMSVVALAHGAFAMERVFGLYAPSFAGRGLIFAPLLNPNNLGGFAAIGVPLWAGLTHRDSRRRVRMAGNIAITVTGTTAILSLSRGAIASLAMSVVFMAFVALTRHDAEGRSPRGEDRVWRRVGAGIAVACSIGAATYFGSGQVAHELQDYNLSKLQLIGRAAAFACQHPLLGVGRGAFSTAFVAVVGGTSRYAYVENFVVQWASEWGLPYTLLLCTASAYALVRSLRGSTSLARVGAATALLSWSAQNLVDLAFELVGVAVVAACLFAALVAPTQQATARKRSGARGGPARAFVLTVLVAGFVALVWIGPALSENAVDGAEAALRESIANGSRQAFAKTLARAVRLHPSEPVFAVLAATEALNHHDSSSERWVRRALTLAPGWSAPHLLAFRQLMGTDRHSAALLELRAGASVDADAAAKYACPLIASHPAFVLAAAPSGPQRARYQQLIGQCLPADHPLSQFIDEALLAESPDAQDVLRRTAYRLVSQNRLDEGLAVVARMLQIQPKSADAYAIRIEFLVQAKRYAAAVDASDSALRALDEQSWPAILRGRIRALAGLGDAKGVGASASQLRRLAGSDTVAVAQAYGLEGDAEGVMGRPGGAFRAYRQAYRFDDNPRYALAIAKIAEGLGDQNQALWAYIELCQREPQNAQYCRRRDELLHPAPTFP